MRLRTYMMALRRKQTKTVTRKQKMDPIRRGKRKSPTQDIIFEVSDNDISSENSGDECHEPEAKLLKRDGESFASRQVEHSNLETLNVEISINQEGKNIEISEHISVSNSSAETSRSGSDIIVISEDNIDVVDIEENYPVPQPESIENSEDKSVDNSEVIDITDENPVFFVGRDRVLINEEEKVSSTDENLVPDEHNGVNLNDQKTGNLEDGELDDSQPETEIDEPIDVTKSPSIEIDVEKEDKDEPDNSSLDPCMQITFRDEKIADYYKSKFLTFLKQFVELEVENSEGLTVSVQRDDTLDPSQWVILDETMCLKETEDLVIPEIPSPLLITPEKLHSKKKKKKKNKKEKELFVLDTNPTENENNALLMKYSSKFQIDIEENASEEGAKVSVSANTCFNCDSNHAIKDCPLPKDFGKINAARQRFKAQKQTSRYHLEEDQKYSHLAPGKISQNLREALGLRKNQLPPFVYHMRLLGYPPGWLEEAKVVHSNLSMFDSEGNDVRSSMKKMPGLDKDKIVDYPGFNVPMEKHVKDESRQYGVPPYSDKFSKHAMIEFFEKLQAKEQDDLETCDMDLDTTYGEKDKFKVEECIQGPVIVNPLLNELKEVDSNMPSPSLTDLEKQKETLLAALEESTSSNPKSVETCGDPETSDQEKSKTEQETPEKLPLNQTLEINVEKTDDSNNSFCSPPLNNSVNNVKMSSFGTPILKSSSPYSRLPNPDNFMKDVSPVINFENLPNSTGKYEQMTGVLQKVRSTLKNMQNCKS